MPGNHSRLNREKCANIIRRQGNYAREMRHKSKTKPVCVPGTDALLCIGVHGAEHELVRHSFVFQGIGCPELVPVFGEMGVTVQYAREGHGGAESTKNGGIWSTVGR